MTTFSLQTLHGGWKKTFVNNAPQCTSNYWLHHVGLNASNSVVLSCCKILYYTEHKTDKLKEEVKS